LRSLSSRSPHKRCLSAGQPWEQDFADGLHNSEVFAPILSKAARTPCRLLPGASACYYLVPRYQLALEPCHRIDLRVIFPVHVVEFRRDCKLGNIYNKFSQGSGVPNCGGDVTVQVTQGKLLEHLDYLGKGALQLPASTRAVKTTLSAIMSNHGVFVLGLRFDTVDRAVATIVKLAAK